MVISLDTSPAPERRPGEFARHPRTGAPYVLDPTGLVDAKLKKAELIALCAQHGIDWESDLDIDPGKTPTVNQLKHLLGDHAKRGRRVQYGRPSSLGKQIENMTNIQKWSERAVALGLFLDGLNSGDLADELLTLTREQWNLDDPDARDALDTIAVKAKNLAQAGLAADRGTHVHERTEDYDNDRDWIEAANRGEDLGLPLEVQAALVAAWERMIADYDLEILAVEATCVDDHWRQAGTLDRIARLHRDLTFILPTGEQVTIAAGTVLILDIKTGKLRLDQAGFVAYWHGYSVQLASYAQSVPYNPDTDIRGEWEWPIDQRWAIIAHLDVLAALEGEAICRLVLVDLEAGREAGERCVWAREWERRTDVFSLPIDDLAVRVPVQVAAPSPPHDVEQPATGEETPSHGTSPVADTDAGEGVPDPSPVDDRRTRLLTRYQQLCDNDKRAYLALNPPKDDLDAIEAALNQVDPFTTHIDPVVPQPTDPVAPDPGAALADRADIDRLVDAIAASGLRDICNQWIREGNDAGHQWNPRATGTVANYERTRAALALAPWFDPQLADHEQVVRALIDFAGIQLSGHVGAVLGLITAAQASTVVDVCDRATAGALLLTFDDNGHPRFVNPNATAPAAA